MIIDGNEAVLGRLATVVAKKALLGETIDIVNAEKIVVSGKKEVVFAKYKRLHDMGTPRKGPYYITQADRFVKRIIRGMVPYKQEKGREALERIKCHVGVPKAFEGKDMETLAAKGLRTNCVAVSEICKHIGGKQ